MPEQVYVDQIASYYAEPCSDGGGAHRNITGGGGSSWADGNRATLKKAVEAVGPGRVLISESNAEAYLGSLHAVSGPLRPFWRAVLTEIYLSVCLLFLSRNIEERNGPGQWCRPAAARGGCLQLHSRDGAVPAWEEG